MATEKRFVYYEHKGADYILDAPNKSLDFIEMLGDCLEAEEIVDLLNEFYEENKKLQFQCNLLQESANEFHRGARENANMVGQLKKENKELKEENKQLKMHMNSAKAYLEGGHIKKAIERLKIIDIR